MSTLLHILATPRGDESNTRAVSDQFIDHFTSHHPDWTIDTLNVFEESLPEMTVRRVTGKYELLSGTSLSDDTRSAWDAIIAHINRFLAADLYLISTPMWNFSIPYKLKQYIDVIVQPRYLFRYGTDGVEGLAKNKRMVIVTSRGGDYSQPPNKAFDFQEPYLRAVFGFVGITDITFVHFDGANLGDDGIRQQALDKAQQLARQTAEDTAVTVSS